MNDGIHFFETLKRAFEFDPNVLPSARRLRRFWNPGARPPAHWTVRWTEEAVDSVRAWAGSDVVRRAGGVSRVDVPRLIRKTGNAAALEAGLDQFLRAMEKPVEPDDGPWRQQVIQSVSSPEIQTWVDHLLQITRVLTPASAFEIVAVIKALELIRPGSGTWHVSVLGSRVGVASKFFRPGMPGRRRLADALLFLKGVSDVSEAGRENVLEENGVLGSDTAYGVLVAGGISVDGFDFPARLAAKGQGIYLTLQNLIRPSLSAGAEGLLTIENEAPFLGAISEGLHKKWVLVATGGFPNRAVISLLKSIVPPGGVWHHWGDTDLAGIRIARTLADRVGRTPDFFRCGSDDVRRWRTRLIPLDPSEKKTLATDLKTHPNELGADVLRTVLHEGGWLEQEAWQSPS